MEERSGRYAAAESSEEHGEPAHPEGFVRACRFSQPGQHHIRSHLPALYTSRKSLLS
jgi:hypothetical protein